MGGYLYRFASFALRRFQRAPREFAVVSCRALLQFVGDRVGNPRDAGVALFSRLAAIACALTSLYACSPRSIDLDAVKEYAKATAVASASFDDLADDYYGSCMRRREYANPYLIGNASLSNPLAQRPTPAPAPSAGSTPTSIHVSGSDASCADASALAYRWQLENHAVVDYVRALGDVAGVDTTPSNIGDVASALKNAGAISDDATASAAGDLATAIAGALIAARQRHAVLEIATQAQDHGLPALAQGLQFNAQQYTKALANERIALNSYYTTILAEEGRAFAATECRYGALDGKTQQILHCLAYGHRPKQKASVRQRTMQLAWAAESRDLIRRQRIDWLNESNLIDRKTAAASEYSDAVADIASGNAALLKAPPNDIGAIVAAVKPYADALSDKVTALAAALRK